MLKKYSAKIKSYLVNTRKIIILYYKSNKAGFCIVFIGTIIVSLAPFANAYVFKLIIDQIVETIKISNFNVNEFIPLITALTIIGSTNKLVWVVISYVETINHLDFKKYLDLLVDKKFSELGFEHYSNPKTNDLLNRVKETYGWRPINFANRQIWIIQNIIEIISNAIAIIALNIWIFLSILISSIPIFLIKIKYGRGSWGLDVAKGSVRRDYWNTSWYLKEERYLEEIRIFGSGQFLMKRINKLYDSFLSLQKKQEKNKFFQSILASLFSLLVFITSEIYIIFLTISQKITLGSLSFYDGRIYRLSDNLQSFFKNLGVSYEDLLYVNDLFEVLELKNKIKNAHKTVNLQNNPHKIEFKNVWFKYPNSKTYALKNFNLTIDPREKVALIGENGGGKTTIIRLLCRFYDVDKGKILINGNNIKNIKLDSWYKCLGILFQDFNRYSFSVKDNIRIGDVDKKYEKEIMSKAASKSQAHNFIKEYKLGYKTVLSKQFNKGVEPSVGQWQKIALARAFFRDAPILILDEPTSAIDAKAETQIFQQLDRFEKDKTVIMISHRFSTVRNADRIYVIGKGKILEAGTHQQLINKKGNYAKLFKLQAKGYK